MRRSLGDEYTGPGPFDGHTVAVASPLESETGVFIKPLRAAGAEVQVAHSEPESAPGEVVEFLDAKDALEAFAEPGVSEEAFEAAQHALLERGADVILDEGCEPIAEGHAHHPAVAADLIGGSQPTAGIHCLEAMDTAAVLESPVDGVNDTPMKPFFDNVHGTGESALSTIQGTTDASSSARRSSGATATSAAASPAISRPTVGW